MALGLFSQGLPVFSFSMVLWLLYALLALMRDQVVLSFSVLAVGLIGLNNLESRIEVRLTDKYRRSLGTGIALVD